MMCRLLLFQQWQPHSWQIFEPPLFQSLGKIMALLQCKKDKLLMVARQAGRLLNEADYSLLLTGMTDVESSSQSSQ
jgi:hypothetical protein